MKDLLLCAHIRMCPSCLGKSCYHTCRLRKLECYKRTPRARGRCRREVEEDGVGISTIEVGDKHAGACVCGGALIIIPHAVGIWSEGDGTVIDLSMTEARFIPTYNSPLHPFIEPSICFHVVFCYFSSIWREV